MNDVAAEKLFADAQAALRAGQIDRGLDVYDRLISEASDWWRTVSMYAKADTLDATGEQTEALRLWDAVSRAAIANRSDTPDPALGLKASVAIAHRRFDQRDLSYAIGLTDALTTRLDAETRRWVRGDLVDLGDRIVGMLVTTRHYTESLQLAEAVMRSMEGEQDPQLLEVATHTRLMYFIALANLGRGGYNDPIVEQIVDAGETAIRVVDEWMVGLERALGCDAAPQIAGAIAIKATALAKLGRDDEAIACLDALLDRARTDPAFAIDPRHVEAMSELRWHLLQ